MRASGHRARTQRTASNGVVRRVRGRVAGELNARKNRMTETLDTVADAIRQAGEPLRRLPYAGLGDYAADAASRIEQVANDLRGRDVQELAHDLGEMARRKPALFVGAGLAAGLLAGRFLKSSPPKPARPRARTVRVPRAERVDRLSDSAMDRTPRRSRRPGAADRT